MDFSAHPNPVQITGLPASMTEIAAGRAHCLAVASDGTIWSWGNNGNFQLGQGEQISQNPIPKQVLNFSNVAVVAGGNNHSVALKTDGSVWIWGSNHQGTLGDGTLNNRFAPVRVTGLQTVNIPSINPQGGTFNLAVDVTITCATPGATIHFTTNNNEPTESDPVVASGGTVRLTSNVTLRVRAWKPGFIPSGPNSATFTVIRPAPQLLLEENGTVSTQLAAVDSVLLLRDPFPLINGTGNQLKSAHDPNTRIILFVLNLQLSPGQPANVVKISLTGPGGFPGFVSAEDVRPIPGVDVTQVIFRLPNNAPPGTYQLQLLALGQSSNFGTIRIKP